jgi:hypothetical protein
LWRGSDRDGGGMVTPYPLGADPLAPLKQVHLPRAPRLYVPGATVHTESAKAFHRARGRRGHFWERRYRACVVEDDTHALAAPRYLDRNPVRAGLGADPAAYPWSSCAAHACGAPNPIITPLRFSSGDPLLFSLAR